MNVPIWSLSSISETITVAVAPVFLLAGISALLGVMTNRLGRIIDRSRILQRGLRDLAGSDAELEHMINKEMLLLLRRGHYINYAINLATGSALLVCIVIMALFLSGLIQVELSGTIAILFIVCMGMLVVSLSLFLVEVFLATRSMRDSLIRSEFVILSLNRKSDSQTL